MAGTTWHIFQAGKKVKASHHNDNFDWAEGSLVPMNEGSTTTNTHDLGTANAKWRSIYLGTSVNIASGGKVRLDGSSGGDTYIYENGANQISMYAGGAHSFFIQSAFVQVGEAVDFGVNSLSKIFLDAAGGSGGDTYLIEDSADQIGVYAGGARVLFLDANIVHADNVDFGVNSLSKIFLDAAGGSGGDTYLVESSTNTMRFFASGASVAFCISDGFGVMDGKFFYIDQGLTSGLKGSTTAVEIYVNNIRSLSVYQNIVYIPKASSIEMQGSISSWVMNIDTADLNKMDYNWSSATKMILTVDGNLSVDGTYSTFSPIIRNDEKYKNKATITAYDYLEWALCDANKPHKPYNGIPALRNKTKYPMHTTTIDSIFETKDEVDAEYTKYKKGLAKISIGIAHWAEEAEKRIAALENA